LRIGIFGNTNNYPLSLAIGLQQLGCDTALVVNRKERLHRPESRYRQFQKGYPGWIFGQFQKGYPGWIFDCSDISENDFVAGSPAIADVLNFLSADSDGLILNHLGPSLREYCPLPSVALMTGSDVTYFGDYRTIESRQETWSREYKNTPGAKHVNRKWSEFISRQRTGLLNAEAVSCPFPGLVPEIDDILRDIGVPDSRRIFLFFSAALHQKPFRTRETRSLRILNGARVNWKKPLPQGFCTQDHKGTDVLLRGFALFLKAGGRGELVLFRKGLHIQATEALVLELGISRNVTWLGEMDLNAFYEQIGQADVVCDQLGESFPGMVAFDAMALGRPVIANFRPSIMSQYYGNAMPGFQAMTEEEVAEHMSELLVSFEKRYAAGLAGRRFAEIHLSPRANAEKCLKAMGLT
jgi:glycosyltransferase involved in cell wall biosynthesis